MKNFYKKICIILFSLFLFGGSLQFVNSETDQTLKLAIENYKKAIHVNEKEVQKINGLSESCSHPKVAAYSDNLIYFVWDGLYKGKRKIFLREYINNKFQEPIIIDIIQNSDNFEPDIAVDENGNPYIVWVSQKNSENTLYYAYRNNNKWNFFTITNESNGLNIESPVIGVKNLGRDVYIAWQAGKGINYHIYTAVRSDEEKFSVYRLSLDTSDHYNLYPQIFTKPYPVVFWYESVLSEFTLVGVKYDEENKTWKTIELDGLSKLASNRLPIIMMNNSANIAGVWYDSIDKLDRIFVGLQNFNNGKGIPTDTNSIFNQSQPYGIFKDNNLIYISFLNNDENQVYFTYCRLENSRIKFWGESIKVSSSEPGFYSNPKISVSENKIIIVWSSNIRDGGDGGVYIKIINVSYI